MTPLRHRIRNGLKLSAYRLRNPLLYRAASFYIDACDNDNDCWFSTDGEQAFARQELPNCRVVFDVGAGDGEWAVLALRTNPNLEIHCFEPTTHRFRIISERLRGKATLRNLALSDAPGRGTIYLEASGGSHSLYPQRYAGERYAPNKMEEVPVSTIDAYCREHGIERIDFMKLDIEGYEPAALKGAERLLRDARIGIAQFEYSYVWLDAGWSLKSLMTWIASVNPDYRFFKLFPDGPREVATYEHRYDNFKTQNWAIALRR